MGDLNKATHKGKIIHHSGGLTFLAEIGESGQKRHEVVTCIIYPGFGGVWATFLNSSTTPKDFIVP